MSLQAFNPLAEQWQEKRRCPECFQECGWCSWYRMNARGSGCGSQHRKTRCKEGQAAKGVPCSTCDGSGYITVTVRRCA